ncbi:hypothetical protein ACLVWU_07805 [Bdellovibrio sp. HCB290]|uniref:hypothetical protein n=1 Tax=Bdellovibrio sp. HCB290 TaxID=3394356 RepID=UPI0039B48332
MNIKHLVTFSVIFTVLGFTSAHAQEEISNPPPASAPSADSPAAPVTGYQGMLPYINENAAIRKEAQKKYGTKKSKSKSKKSKKSKSKNKSKKGSAKKSKTSKKTSN